MMVLLKAGTRLRSQTGLVEVVVVKGPGAEVDLRCGGQPMLEANSATAPTMAPVPPFGGETLLGKRYVSEDGTLEVLCTKPGEGSLSVSDTGLGLKGTKPLPSSD